MKGRTIREFNFKSDIWPLVDKWASENGFVLTEQETSSRTYRKGNRMLTAPAFLAIEQKRGRVVLQAWVKADMFLIMSVLTGKPAEAGVESGGLTASIPRLRAKTAVNQLLKGLGQEPIV